MGRGLGFLFPCAMEAEIGRVLGFLCAMGDIFYAIGCSLLSQRLSFLGPSHADHLKFKAVSIETVLVCLQVRQKEQKQPCHVYGKDFHFHSQLKTAFNSHMYHNACSISLISEDFWFLSDIPPSCFCIVDSAIYT